LPAKGWCLVLSRSGERRGKARDRSKAMARLRIESALAAIRSGSTVRMSAA
jgi:hypothetical protein